MNFLSYGLSHRHLDVLEHRSKMMQYFNILLFSTGVAAWSGLSRHAEIEDSNTNIYSPYIHHYTQARGIYFDDITRTPKVRREEVNYVVDCPGADGPNQVHCYKKVCVAEPSKPRLCSSCIQYEARKRDEINKMRIKREKER